MFEKKCRRVVTTNFHWFFSLPPHIKQVHAQIDYHIITAIIFNNDCTAIRHAPCTVDYGKSMHAVLVYRLDVHMQCHDALTIVMIHIMSIRHDTGIVIIAIPCMHHPMHSLVSVLPILWATINRLACANKIVHVNTCKLDCIYASIDSPPLHEVTWKTCLVPVSFS